jgi:hypothetical protein
MFHAYSRRNVERVDRGLRAPLQSLHILARSQPVPNGDAAPWFGAPLLIQKPGFVTSAILILHVRCNSSNARIRGCVCALFREEFGGLTVPNFPADASSLTWHASHGSYARIWSCLRCRAFHAGPASTGLVAPLNSRPIATPLRCVGNPQQS